MGIESKQEPNKPSIIENKDQAYELVQSDLRLDISVRSSKYTTVEAELKKIIADRYKKGDRLISKDGIVWVWKTQDGSQRGEVIPPYITYRRDLTEKLQGKILTYLSEKTRSEAMKTRKLEAIDTIELAKKQIPDAILKDFPAIAKIDASRLAKFWSQVYKLIEEGFTKYQHTSPENFTLQNEKTKKIVLFAEDKTQQETSNRNIPGNGEVRHVLDAETEKILEDTRQDVPGSFEKGLAIADQVASENNDLQRIHNELKEYFIKAKNKTITPEELTKVNVDIAKNFVYLEQTNPQAKKTYEKYRNILCGLLGLP